VDIASGPNMTRKLDFCAMMLMGDFEKKEEDLREPFLGGAGVRGVESHVVSYSSTSSPRFN
jgi:hypothetical protein